MTATTMARAERRAPSRPGSAEPWAGTLDLLRLYLRLDRIRILVWTVSIGLLVAGSVASMKQIYTTPESLQARAALMANPSAVMMTGPAFGLDNYTFGAMVANELSLYLLPAPTRRPDVSRSCGPFRSADSRRPRPRRSR